MAKKKKEKKEEKSKEEQLAIKQEIDELTKKYEAEKVELVLQNNNLAHKVKCHENTISILQQKIDEFSVQLGMRLKENTDIYEHSELVMRQKEKRMDEYEREIANLRVIIVGKDQDKQHSELELKKKHEKETRELNGEVQEMHEELKLLQRYKSERQMVEKKFQDMKRELDKKDVQFFQKLKDVKEEYEKQILDLKQDIKNERRRALEEFSADSKTQRLMALNEELRRDSAQQLDEIKKLNNLNINLQNEFKKLKREIAMQKEANDEILRQNHAQSQSIKMLTSKISKLEDTFKMQKQREKIRKLGESESEVLFDKLRDEIDQRNAEITSLQERIIHYQEQQKMLEKSVNEQKKEIESKYSSLDEMAHFLLTVLHDVKAKVTPWKQENKYIINETEQSEEWPANKLIPPTLDKLNPKEREGVLKYILSKLHIFDRERKSKAGTEQIKAAVNIPNPFSIGFFSPESSAPLTPATPSTPIIVPTSATGSVVLPNIHSKNSSYG